MQDLTLTLLTTLPVNHAVRRRLRQEHNRKILLQTRLALNVESFVKVTSSYKYTLRISTYTIHLGDTVEALNQSWHAKCFVCSMCNKPFGGKKFINVENKPYWYVKSLSSNLITRLVNLAAEKRLSQVDFNVEEARLMSHKVRRFYCCCKVLTVRRSGSRRGQGRQSKDQWRSLHEQKRYCDQQSNTLQRACCSYPISCFPKACASRSRDLERS